MAKSPNKEIQDFINGKIEDCKRIRKPYSIKWIRNLLYYLDKWQVEYNQVSDKWRETNDSSESRDVTMVEHVPVNLVFTKYERLCNDIHNLGVSFTATPLSQNIEHKTGAKMAERVLNGRLADKIAHTRGSLLFWILWATRSLVKVYWRKKSGPVLEIPDITVSPTDEDQPMFYMENGELVYGDNGEKIPLTDNEEKQLFRKFKNGIGLTKKFYPGDVELSVISPFEYFIDPDARGEFSLFEGDQRARWVIQQKLVDEDWVEEEGYDKEGVKFEEGMLSDFEDIQLSVEKLPKPMEKKHTIYTEFWALPSKKWPNGKLVIIIGEKVVTNENLPEPYLKLNALPFVDFADDYTPMSWYSKPWMERLLPLQKAYGELNSIILQLARKIGYFKLLVHGRAGSIKARPVINDEFINEVLYHQSNTPPIPLRIEQIPMALLRHLDWILRDIEYLAGIHQPNWNMKKNVLATEILQNVEQDEKKVNKFIGMLSYRWSIVGRLALELIKHNYIIGREITYVNDFGIVEKTAFSKQTFWGDYTVDINLGKPLYMSRAATWAMVERLIQLGVITDRDQILDILNLNKTLEDVQGQSDYRRQQLENLRLLQSFKKNLDEPEMPEVREFHNHPVHIRGILEFLNDYYDDLNAKTATKAIEHYRKHVTMYQEQQLQQIRMMQLARQESATNASQPTDVPQ